MSKSKNYQLFRIFLRTKAMILFSIILFVIGTILAFNSSADKVFLSPGIEETTSNFPLIGTIVIFAIFLTIQIIFFLSIRKLFTSLSESDKEILGGVASIKDSETDEIKELVMTRNMLLMKLTDNKEALKKAKAQIEKDVSNKTKGK